MRFKEFIKENKKSHFVYQKNVPDYQTIVHRGTEASSKKYIKDKAKFFLHKGKDFVIYKKPKGGGIRPSDALDFKYVHEENVNEADPKVGTGKKPKGSDRRLYTDENPKDTVSIKFATPADAKATVAKVKKIKKPYARKIQILTVGEQRAKVMGKMEVVGIFKKAKQVLKKQHEAKKEK